MCSSDLLLKYLGINKIDYTFISHIDADHYRGIFSLIKNGFIKNLYKPKLDSSLNKDVKFEKFLKNYHIPIVYYKKQVFKIDNSRIYVLTDTTFFKNGNFDTNDKSGIIKVIYGNTSILFTGDATKNIEKKYVWVYGKFLKSDILKVGHHGSKTSTSMQFLNYVKPGYALISCGIGNKFHHPNNATINELKDKKIKIERTDLLGAIIMSSDGNNFKIINWRN